MDNEQIDLVNKLLKDYPLSTLEEKVFRGCLKEETYNNIANQLGYTHDHIRSVGSGIFRRLSLVLGYRVKKREICEILQREDFSQYLTPDRLDQPTILPQTKHKKSDNLELKYPDGIIPLDSKLYIPRPWLETNCYQAILQQESLIRLHSAQKTGKSSLLIRMLDFAQKRGFKTVCLSFALATKDKFLNTDSFSQWFCAMVSEKLNLPHRVKAIWDNIFGANYNTIIYFEKEILPCLEQPLFLGLDDVNLLFEYEDIAKDFFSLLRSWSEQAKLEDLNHEKFCQKIHFIIAHSTEGYLPLNMNNSPFNVGLSIRLPSFTFREVEELIRICGLQYHQQLNRKYLQELINLVGGNPYLIQVFFYCLSQENTDVEKILTQAPTDQGIYRHHLTYYLNYLSRAPHLAKLYYQIVTATEAVDLSSQDAFKLDSLGLVIINNNQAVPCCDLYRKYFSKTLEYLI